MTDKLSDALKYELLGYSVNQLDESWEEVDIGDMRIVESIDKDSLTSIDEDGEILGVKLRLAEGCEFDFERHANSIEKSETDAKNKSKSMNASDNSHEKIKQRFRQAPSRCIKY